MILIACGLQREARLLAGPGILAIPGGGDAARLEAALEAQVADATLVLSCGIAGALDQALKAGDVVIDIPESFPGEGRGPASARDDVTRNAAPEGGSKLGPGLRRGSGIWKILRVQFANAHYGTIIGQDHIAATSHYKGVLYQTTSALAVDMESHIARRVAARHGLPCAAIRTISDTALETLPPAALIGMNPDGSMALGRVLLSLARRPAQLPALIRTGRSAELAFKALGEVGAELRVLLTTTTSEPSPRT
jgi:hypothetical protein